MKHTRTEDDKYLIKLEPGDKILSSLTSLAANLNFTSGKISGIGAVKDPLIAYFDINEKKYIEKSLRGNFELLNLQGNLSVKDKNPFFHIHVILGDAEMKTFGGHLIEAEVTVTAELILLPINYDLKRIPDEQSSLWLWNL